MGLVYTGLILLPILWIASQLWALYNNYRAALLTGLPIVVIPYNPHGFLHMVFSLPLRPLVKSLLPARVFSAAELVIAGWEFRDKAAAHIRMGPAFVIVTTGVNQLICADPALAHEVLAKRKEFVRSKTAIKIMSFLGTNILTVNGESWSRQRRIIAPAVNERFSPDVWKETAEQATSLADHLLSSFPSAASATASPAYGESSDVIPGLRAVAVNVLTRVAYGHRKAFALPCLPRDPKANMSYVDGICLCAEFLVVAALVPIWMLRLPIMPKLVQTLGVALAKLPELTRDMLDQERQRAAGKTSAGDAPDTIMSMLVRLSDQEKNQSDDAAPLEKKSVSFSNSSSNNNTSTNKSYLTEEEIAGNLFIFTIAGFDSTTNTMAYGVVILAAYPEWQTWIQAEIDAVLGPVTSEGQDETLPDYATAFPKLTRCLALMFETLRLFPPLPHLVRSIVTTQTMSSSLSSPPTFPLQAPSVIYLNTVALQTSPSTWGPDALDFKPTRWLQPVFKVDEAPQLKTPPRGAFLPWSAGPRVCPGQKMSQVEFVAVVATLFRKCTAEPVPRKEESMQQARQRLLDLMQDSQPAVTLQMKRPKDVHLRWARR